MEKNLVFDSLCSKVKNCTSCSRMADSLRVLNRSVGSLSADIMFIGEAPGRLGADESGIPFHGDKAGHNFEELLKFANINRADIYITNAVLCNPRDDKGNNSTPTIRELNNCCSFLMEQIEIVNPKLVITLGANALSATNLIYPHNLVLKTDVRTANKWFGRTLIPLYHPGQRAMISRSMANQRSDYKFVIDQLCPLNRKATSYGKSALDTALLVDYIFSKQYTFTYFALHKLFYLLEYKSVKEFGHRLTDAYIIRQKDGPYCTDINLFKLKKALPYLRSRNLSKNNIEVFYDQSRLFEDRLIDKYDIPENVKEFIDRILDQYGRKSNAALKKAVYFSQPMRNILHLETTSKTALYNMPIDFSTSSIY